MKISGYYANNVMFLYFFKKICIKYDGAEYYRNEQLYMLFHIQYTAIDDFIAKRKVNIKMQR